MAKILVVTGHLVSEANGALGLSRRLAADGHEILLGGSGRAPGIFADAGFRTVELPHCDLNRLASKMPPPEGLHDWLPARRRERQAAVMTANGADSLIPILTSEYPDLVIAHVELHEHIISTLSRDIPLALFTRMFHGRASTQAPPRNTSATPHPEDPVSHARIALLWIRLWAWKRWQALRRWYAEAGADPASALKALARSRGVNLRSLTTTWRYQYPWAYRKLPVLVMQARELDFPFRLNASVRYVGPMLQVPEHLDTDASAALGTLQGARPPRIFGAFGSILSFDPQLLTRIWQIFRNNPSWTGVFVTTFTPPERPPNVHVVKWASQSLMLQYADLCIAHGGAGTISECVQAEVPMLLFPTPNTGLMGNAARVVSHGLGRVSTASSSAETIEADMRSLLVDGAVRNRLHLMAETGRAYEINKVAEHTVREILEDRATA